MQIETGYSLSKLTTIGTGGPAAAFARPQSLAQLEEALAWAAERGLGTVAVGLGSNLLAADEGVDALVLRLEGDRLTYTSVPARNPMTGRDCVHHVVFTRGATGSGADTCVSP